MTPAQIADELGVQAATLRNPVQRGALTAVKLGRGPQPGTGKTTDERC